MRVFVLAPLVALVSFVFAHPGDYDDHPASNEELIARNIEIEERNVEARKCADQIAQYEAKLPITTAIPSNASCVLHPETIEGPYYIRNEYVRSDIRESQPGVSLTLDVGLIDSRNCQPIKNAFVEIWAANATGAYGGYTGPTGQPTRIHEDTWLRGGIFTNDKGLVELKTIYPGYYTGRTTHIHTMVHTGAWQTRSNGTFVSGTGTLNHIGQFFFDESWNDRVFASYPYNTNTVPRTLNNRDFIMQQAGAGAVVKLQYLQSTLDQGLLGYITVVVNGGRTYTIQNKNALR
ncbi:Intradiol ring-cleavage dioxygenase [Coprinopsis sp. MPI-PUGE-AT-0042]|nr:Intradiol ring-cleavage dioxygenase [Coprinopsis sp. MPI-PUGE-AT-0042]